MDLKQVLPPDYEENLTMIELQDILSEETDAVESAVSQVLSERFINTASETLSRREKMFGIASQAGCDDLETRRRIISSKLIGRGTLTKEALEKFVKTFLDPGNEVKIIEKNEQYIVQININWQSSITREYLDIIRNSLREVIPAHMAFNLFVIREERFDLYFGSGISTYSDICIDHDSVNKPIDISCDQKYGVAYFNFAEINISEE